MNILILSASAESAVVSTIFYLVLGLGAFIGIVALIVFLTKLAVASKTADAIMAKYKGSPESKSVYLKKYAEADAQSYSSTFFRMGFIFALVLSILAFSYTTYERTGSLQGDLMIPDDMEVEPPSTKREQTPPPPPPPPEIKVVEDEKIIEETPQIEMEEVDEETAVAEPVAMAEEEVKEEEIFTIVEDMPVFPGGEKALLKYLASIPYPAIAKENDIQGSVYIRFVVDKTGQVTNVEVAKGADRILNEAALEHIKRMPGWTPGKQRGKPVKVQYIVPIKFRLD